MSETPEMSARTDEDLAELASLVEIEQEKRACLKGIHATLNALARQYNAAGGDMEQFVMLAQQAAANSALDPDTPGGGG